MYAVQQGAWNGTHLHITLDVSKVSGRLRITNTKPNLIGTYGSYINDQSGNRLYTFPNASTTEVADIDVTNKSSITIYNTAPVGGNISYYFYR